MAVHFEYADPGAVELVIQFLASATELPYQESGGNGGTAPGLEPAPNEAAHCMYQYHLQHIFFLLSASITEQKCAHDY